MIARIRFPAPEPAGDDDDRGDCEGLTAAQLRTLDRLPRTLRKATWDWWHYRVCLAGGVIIDFAAADLADAEGWLVLRDARPVAGKWPPGMECVRDVDVHVSSILWATEIDS